MLVKYFKRHQRDEIWSYYKLLSNRTPPACERLIFLNPKPAVNLSEYDPSQPGSRIDYNAIEDNGDPITAAEYEAAYRQATAGEFTLYINGKPQ